MRARALAWLLLALPAPALAAPTSEELAQSQAQLESTQEEKQQLSAKQKKIQSELEELQRSLVTRTNELYATEAELAESQEKLNILEGQITQRNTDLKQQQKRLNALVRASISLSHTPSEAMIMMPGDVTQTMKAARALKMSSEGVRELTRSLATQLSELGKMKEKVAAGRTALEQRQKKLAAEREELSARLEKRQKLQESLNEEGSRLEAELKKLARKTSDLKELLSAIEQERETLRTASRKPGTDMAQAKGELRPPAQGKLAQRYGASEGKNATARGVTLKTAARATVSAPYDGEVVFTGPFLTYGDMVILHHAGGYHTLLAGLDKIDVNAGQFLLEGEPIGAMGEGEGQTRLYVELRKNNQPIDPAPWVRGWGKK